MSENYTDDTVTISRGEYEDFVRDRHTVELICEIIRRGRVVSLPLLKVLVGMQDDSEVSGHFPDGIGITIEEVEDL